MFRSIKTNSFMTRFMLLPLQRSIETAKGKKQFQWHLTMMFILFRNRMLSIRSSSRDFAYVARDRSTRKHMCHVFRCDIPARTIANTLRDICKKIMIERSQHQNLAKPVDINGRTSLATRPTNLPTEHRRFHRNGQALVSK